MKYQWIDEEKRVVHIIDDDGKSYKSMLVVGRDDVLDNDFEKYKQWIASGNSVLFANEKTL
jgi:hypothetical protein